MSTDLHTLQNINKRNVLCLKSVLHSKYITLHISHIHNLHLSIISKHTFTHGVISLENNVITLTNTEGRTSIWKLVILIYYKCRIKQ